MTSVVPSATFRLEIAFMGALKEVGRWRIVHDRRGGASELTLEKLEFNSIWRTDAGAGCLACRCGEWPTSYRLSLGPGRSIMPDPFMIKSVDRDQQKRQKGLSYLPE